MAKTVHANYLNETYRVLDRVFEGYDKKIETITHYTSTKVLNSLLDKATFWASNIFYQNDSKEYKTGLSALQDKLKNDNTLEELGNVKPSNSNIYTISFSSKKDELQQWITYAKEGGVCIEFDKDLIKEFVVYCGGENNYCISLSKVLRPEIYDEDKGNSIIENLRKNFNISVSKEKFADDSNIKEDYWTNEEYKGRKLVFLQLMASYFKNPSFYGEDEVRASFTQVEFNDGFSDVKYDRKENGMLRPYMEILFKHDDKDMLPIKSIVIGPASNQNMIFDGIVHRFRIGNNKIWDYSKNNKVLLRKRFDEYFVGALIQIIQEKRISIDKETVSKVYDKMKERYFNEFQDEEEIKKIKESLKLRESDYSDIFKSMKVHLEMLSHNEVETICNWIEEDNFFSKEGIWIYKSKIPYVFS